MPFTMVPMPIKWRPLEHDLLTDAEAALVQRAIHEELRSWVGTPYMLGQSVKGYGVDCIRFDTALLDWATGKTTPVGMYPQDICLHDPKMARSIMRKVKRRFDPLDPVFTDGDRTVEAGDLMIVGPKTGGPGHSILVGGEPSTLFEAGTNQVQQIGMGLEQSITIFEVYRHRDKHEWPRSTS